MSLSSEGKTCLSEPGSRSSFWGKVSWASLASLEDFFKTRRQTLPLSFLLGGLGGIGGGGRKSGRKERRRRWKMMGVGLSSFPSIFSILVGGSGESGGLREKKDKEE